MTPSEPSGPEQWGVARRLFEGGAVRLPHRGCFCAECLAVDVPKSDAAREILRRVEEVLGKRLDPALAPLSPPSGEDRRWSEEDHFLSALRWAARNR